jgi:short-subunit dehydrogenase
VAWLADDRFAASRLIVVTSNAVAAVNDDGVSGLAQAPVWGLVRAAQAEHPGRIVLVDTDDPAGGSPQSRAALSWTALPDCDEPQLALRGDTVLTPRLTRSGGALAASSAAGDAMALPGPDGTVLVTGGTGALGGLIARHLVTEYGVRRLILLSRGGEAAPGAAALVTDLSALGAEVTVAAGDCADRQALAAVLGSVPPEHPLTAVVHSAGVVDDGALGALDSERVDAVLRPKIDAAWHLHDLLRAAYGPDGSTGGSADTGANGGKDTSGDASAAAAAKPVALILFSSATATLGGAGQSVYAAANAFLDAFAHHRALLGLPTVALSWGPWQLESGGMAASLDPTSRRRLRRSGVLPLTADDGLALFDLALRAMTGADPAKRPAALVPIRLDLAVLRAAEGALPPLLRALAGGNAASSPAVGDRASAAAAELRARLAGLAGDDRQQVLLELVRRDVSEVLGHANPSAVALDRAFSDQGFDSLTAVELRNRLTTATGLRLPASLVFDYPTARVLARHLNESLPRDDVPSTAPVLAALDRLSQALAGIAPDHPERDRIARRLRAVAADWNPPSAAGGDPADGEGPDGGARIALESADDDAVFDFLTNELGIS